jgi:rhamnulokinase
MNPIYLAIDLGAGSGRVIAGRMAEKQFELEIVHRFPNPIRNTTQHERWDTGFLWNEIKTGIKKLSPANARTAASIGVDSWGVDYGLFDRKGNLLEEPVCYRDRRTAGMMEKVFDHVPKEELFRATGIQFLPFNTIFQLFAQKTALEIPATAERLLMIPDIFHYFLSGSMGGEYSNATTGQLVNSATRQWDDSLFTRLGLPRAIMPALGQPGDRAGVLTEELQTELGLPAVNIINPATHDTASAIAGAPLPPGWAYISSGTWSLLGVETPAPVIDDRAFRYNFTNEGGAYGANCLLKNLMGLWILESCRAEWKQEGAVLDYTTVIKRMQKLPPSVSFINPDDRRFLRPVDMRSELRAYLRETGQAVPEGEAALCKMILESLALRYAVVIEALATITGNEIQGIQIFGGGSQNDFLNQAAADASGLPVIAGPVEATAIGNLLVQAISSGRFANLAQARDYVSRFMPLQKFKPRDPDRWKARLDQYRKFDQDG